MKNKKTRLNLNRETVRGLTDQDLGQANGGGFIYPIVVNSISCVGGDCGTGTIQPIPVSFTCFCTIKL